MKLTIFYNILCTLSLISGNKQSIETGKTAKLFDRRNLNYLRKQRRQVYNPVDPMKYLLEGVNNQYSTDYNFGTNGFDPNKFNYMYSGNIASANGRSFIPKFSSSGMFQNSPNYQQPDTNDVKSTEPPPNIRHEILDKDDKKQLFGNFDVITPTLLMSFVTPTSPSIIEPEIMPPLMMEQIPEETMRNLNMTNMFIESPFRGQPGMLGYGAQISVPKPPIMSNNYTLVKQENLPEPVITKYSDMLEINGRNFDLNGNSTSYSSSPYSPNKDLLKQDTSEYENIKPVDNFVVLNPFDNVLTNEAHSNDTETEKFVGYQNSFQNIKPITTGYDWNGEWPGQPDSTNNQDWSGGWAKNWDNKPEKESRVSVPLSQPDNDTDSGDGSGIIGSIPNGDETQGKNNQDKLDGMQTALDVFQQFLSFLRSTNLSVGFDPRKSTNKDFDYNEMAKSWAKDIHA